jgi:hypothetical protein
MRQSVVHMITGKLALLRLSFQPFTFTEASLKAQSDLELFRQEHSSDVSPALFLHLQHTIIHIQLSSLAWWLTSRNQQSAIERNPNQDLPWPRSIVCCQCSIPPELKTARLVEMSSLASLARHCIDVHCFFGVIDKHLLSRFQTRKPQLDLEGHLAC